MTRTIIDIHPHIISPDADRYPISPIGGKQSTWSIERPASIEDLAEQMDASGVDKAAIVQSSTVYGFDNSYVADAIQIDTDRFGGVYSVDFRAPDVRETIDRWADRPGMVGLRIFTTGSTLPGQVYPVDDPATYEAWEHAAGRGLPVCVQMTFGAIPELRRLLERFPNSTVILDHFAQPPLENGSPYEQAAPLFDLADYSNLLLKLTPRILERAREGEADPKSFLGAVVDRFGADRIAWGSNYPNDVGSLQELLDDALVALDFLPDGALDQVFAGTAQRLYPMLEA